MAELYPSETIVILFYNLKSIVIHEFFNKIPSWAKNAVLLCTPYQVFFLINGAKKGGFQNSNFFYFQSIFWWCPPPPKNGLKIKKSSNSSYFLFFDGPLTILNFRKVHRMITFSSNFDWFFSLNRLS